jgi:hypothetical protein
MYEIDFNTCTAADVIERSYILHPNTLADSLRSAAQVYSDYARVAANMNAGNASQAAQNLAYGLQAMVRSIKNKTLNTKELDLEQTMQALYMAAKLQCLPEYLTSDIARRYRPA